MNGLALAALIVGGYVLLSKSRGGLPLFGSSPLFPRAPYGIDPRTGLPLGYPPGSVSPITGAHAGNTNPIGSIISGITGVVGTLLRPGNANPTPPPPAGPAGGSVGVYTPPGIPPNTQGFPTGYEDVPAPPLDLWFDNPTANLPVWFPTGDLSIIPDFAAPPVWNNPDLRFDDPRHTGFDPTLGGALKGW